MKAIEDYEPVYNCRFHPTNYWHEVGCQHQEWTKEQLQEALDMAKRSRAYQAHILSHPEDTLPDGILTPLPLNKKGVEE